MLLCLHEEIAVAIAQGYAKVTGKAMAAAVHSNVGLFHATMAIFNAWCDRTPVLILGATGPVDAAKRRPWIDWIHTARDQGAIVRDYTKWDDQPASPAAAREAIIRAHWIANTAPMGPVYINLDAEMQESKLTETLGPIEVARFMPPTATTPAPELVAQAAKLLKSAKNPVILMGRVSRSLEGWDQRVALAETLNAKVITELKLGAAFPTDHPLHAGPPGSTALGPQAQEALSLGEIPKRKVVFLKSHKAESSKKCHGSVCSPYKHPGHSEPCRAVCTVHVDFLRVSVTLRWWGQIRQYKDLEMGFD